jgi:hypothetical protein
VKTRQTLSKAYQIKSVVLLGTSWGTHCKFEEPFENLMGTHWKHEKQAQNPPSSKQKTLSLLNTCCITSLAE